MSSIGSYDSSGSLTDDNNEDRSPEGSTSAEILSNNSLSSIEDLQEAVAGVKRSILETEVNSQQRKDLVMRLIKLKIKEQDLEHSKFYQTPGEVESLRHALVPLFQKLPYRSYCEECICTVWPLLQTTYQCKTCSLLVHGHCLARLSRKCVGAWQHPLELDEEVLSPWDGSVSMTICPEYSLVEQKYQCGECQMQLTPDSGHRLCDYTGKWYCQSCHWGATTQSPARIVHNWDFTPMQVCQSSLHYLDMMRKKPVLNLKTFSVGLSVVTTELSAVVQQRKSVMEMKKYLTVCRFAIKERILRKLESRQHFIDNDYMFSIQDLVDTESGELGTWLEEVLSNWREHITTCVLCRAKGFICELCPDKAVQTDVIFHFDVGIDVCPDCDAVFHRDCFRSNPDCPRCERKRNRRNTLTDDSPA